MPAKSVGMNGTKITPMVIGDPVIDEEAQHLKSVL